MADGLLLILSGIPGSGKTTFAQELIEKKWEILGKYVHFIYVSYDDFIPENIAINSSSYLDSWKSKRKEILDGVEELIVLNTVDQCNKTKKEENSFSQGKINVSKYCECGVDHMTRSSDVFHVIVIDDNMYYRSMRYEYYQLARKVSFGFVEITLSCPLDVALCRNAARPQPVSKDTIVQMSDRIEMPEPDKFAWEKYSVVIATSCSISDKQWEAVLDLLCESSSNIPPAVQVLDEEEKVKDRAITEQNIIHQADQVIRKYISTKLSLMKGNVSKNEMREVGEKLNKKRKTVMERIKKDPLEIIKEDYVDSLVSNNENMEKTSSVDLKHPSDNHRNKDAVFEKSRFEMSLNIEHFWNVVSSEDFTKMVQRCFDDCQD